jgi:chaperonin GroES
MSKFPIQPLHEKIVVKPFPPEQISAGGIIVPDTVQERPSKATVVAIGTGLDNRPMTLKVGDIVFHVKNAGTPVRYNSEEYFVLRDVEVLCTLDE